MGGYKILFFTEKLDSRASCWAGSKQIFAVRIDAAHCQKSCHSNLHKGNTNCHRLTGNKWGKLEKSKWKKKNHKSKIKQYNNKAPRSPFFSFLRKPTNFKLNPIFTPNLVLWLAVADAWMWFSNAIFLTCRWSHNHCGTYIHIHSIIEAIREDKGQLRHSLQNTHPARKAEAGQGMVGVNYQLEP